MVALADKFACKEDTSENSTTQNFRRPQNAYGDFFVQPKNRGPATNNRILSQKYLDDSTGWYYYGFRYYSPELGRWLSRDPVGEEGGVNRYAAIENSLMNDVDALGLAPVDASISWELVVGTPFFGWFGASSSDEWGQPRGVGSGYAYVDAGGTRATTRVWVKTGHRKWWGRVRNACNTVYFPPDGDSGQHSGGIRVYLRSKCGGKFTARFRVLISLRGTGAGGSARGSLFKRSGSSSLWFSVWSGLGTTQKPDSFGPKIVKVTVELAPGSKKKIMKYIPSISFSILPPTTITGTAFGRIEWLDTVAVP